MRKRTKVEDGLVFNGKTWGTVLRVPDPLTGSKVKWEGGFADKKAAKLARDEARIALTKRNYIPPTKLTVGEYLDKWLTTKKVAPSSLRSYVMIVTRYLKPQLGAIKLQDLRAYHVSQLLTNLETTGVRTGGLSSRTRQLVGTVLRMALKDAVNIDGLINVNPATKVRLPRPAPKTPTPYTREETKRLLKQATTHRLYFFFRLAAYTGARRGELCALRWSDFDGSALMINKSRVTVNGVPVEQNRTKGGLNHQRRVPLDADTIKELHAHKERQALEKLYLGADVWIDSGYIFVTESGEPIHPDTPSRVFGKLRKAAGLRHNRLHDARHVHATELLRSGEPLHVVANRLGHRDAMVTATVYAHVDTEQAVSAADTFATRMRDA